MQLFKKNSPEESATPPSPQTTQPAITKPGAADSTPSGDGSVQVVKIRKGQSQALAPTADRTYTLCAWWGQKDYDLYALVLYVDGHTEVVSCFGTKGHARDFSMRTKDGAVIHVSGDKATSDQGGEDLPQEIMHITLNSTIQMVVPVVYSAKNSGVGSFYRYKVGVCVIPGLLETVDPDNIPRGSIVIEPAEANKDDNVYTMVPAIIHNGPDGPKVEAVELYSARRSELRPTVHGGVVCMDNGPENADKPRPRN